MTICEMFNLLNHFYIVKMCFAFYNFLSDIFVLVVFKINDKGWITESTLRNFYLVSVILLLWLIFKCTEVSGTLKKPLFMNQRVLMPYK